MAAWQIGKPKISDSEPQKMFHAVADHFEHAVNLPVYSLSQHNA